MTAPSSTKERGAAVQLASLSPLAQAMLARSQTIARLVCAAHEGGPAALRATARRYAEASAELLATGHEDVGCLLKVFGETARRNADLIEAGLRNPRKPHWLRSVEGM